MSCGAAKTFQREIAQVATLHPQVSRAARLHLSRGHQLATGALRVVAAADRRDIAARRRKIASCFGEYVAPAGIQTVAARRAGSPHRRTRA